MNVYGASMGSSIGQELVISHPSQVRKLVLESVTYSVRVPECKVLLAVLKESAANPATAPGVRKEAQANLAWNGSWDQLSGIQKNVMLVVGTNDILTPQPVTVQMAGQINGSWLERYKDLPHIGSRNAPVQYGENTLDFLGREEQPPYPF
jgi:pimeloyl-ACP methyl ester carboxylesterase